MAPAVVKRKLDASMPVTQSQVDAVLGGARLDQVVADHRKMSKNAQSRLYHDPTSAQEVAQLTDANELYRSNLFKWQLEELIKQVSLDYEKQKIHAPLEKALWQLKEAMEKMPSQPEATVCEICVVH